MRARETESENEREREREEGEGGKEGKRERERELDQSGFTTLADDARLLHRILRIGKAPELPPSSYLPVPSNYVSLLFAHVLNILSFHM